MLSFRFLGFLMCLTVLQIPMQAFEKTVIGALEDMRVSEIPLRPSKAFPPMNQIYHPISTTNPEAQKSFNQGLTYIFAFNHDIAYREFEKAAQLDPDLAIAYWGMALALGQNVNADVTPENELKSYELIQKAIKLSSKASANEQAYIAALATRYTDDPRSDLIPLRYHYREAMKKVIEAYPEDLDALALYAESILDLDPWKWWTLDGKPREGTMEAINVLDSVLTRNPDHIGANHYYIHALEESPFPSVALPSADRLLTLLPASGHLLHMPCHIFLITGFYKKALETNTKAVEADRDYIKKNGMEGNYPLHYLRHNLYVLARTYMLMENYPGANKMAMELNDFLKPYYEKDHHLAHFAYVPLEIFLYFQKWKEILAYQPPSPFPVAQAYLHFSRAMAFAALGDLDSAQKEKDLMLQAKKGIGQDETIANNPASEIFEIAELLINASFAKAENKYEAYFNYLVKAIERQDQLNYDEPPAWFMPIRQTLGFALLEQNQYTAAESVFRKTLQSLQRNGRSLYGLWLSLKGQNRTLDAFWVERELASALENAAP